MKQLYYNRDLSWLGFNYRVLQEAMCPKLPLYERFKFLSIFSSNLDEFFRVRYPGILALSALSNKTQSKINFETKDITIKTQQEINTQLEIYGKILTEELLPELEKEGTVLYYKTPVKKEHTEETRYLFLSKILSFIQPIFLDNAATNNFIPENGQLYLIVSLAKPGSDRQFIAAVNIPSEKLQRFYSLKSVDGVRHIVFIDDIIRQNIDCIFPGFNVSGIYSIKFNRYAELALEDEYSGDIVNKIEKQLKKREFGPPSRFLFETGMPKNLQLFLASSYGIGHEEMFEGGRYHNLEDLAKLPFPNEMKYEEWTPAPALQQQECGDIFRQIEEKDILLHFPYHSYDTILSFFNQAAIDPEVKEIYIALYRVASGSHIVNALISAVKNGKKVTVFVELKARFDEENNLYWSKLMEEAGVNIIYSIPGIKVHSKVALVIKNNGNHISYYSVLSTGNFNETTAGFYADHALLTANDDINKELCKLFQFLKERKEPPEKPDLKFKHLLVSKFNMIDRFEKLIDEEIEKHKNGLPAHIRIKVNNLEEPYVIDLLYKASRKGVKVDLLVRSVCCIVPGVLELSENITIKRLVDRYLEHSRLFIFGDGDDAIVIIGSADWMTRNLRRRIEVCVPVEDKNCRKELIDYFDIQWHEDNKSVYLTADMDYTKWHPNENVHYNVQYELYNYVKNK